MRKIIVGLIAVLVVLAGLAVPGKAAEAVTVGPTLGCNGEPVEKRPGIAPPFLNAGSIHFGFVEWHFPPSCRDDLKRDYVKVYKVQVGMASKVYSTTGDRDSKRFASGTYRVKVRYAYRYWQKDTDKHGKWRTITTSKTIRVR